MTTINITGDYLIAQGQTETNNAYVLLAPGVAATPYPNFTDQGTVQISSSQANATLAAITTGAFGAGSGGSLIDISPSGSLTVSATGSGSAAYADLVGQWPLSFENDGTVNISAVATAVGPAVSAGLTNTGTIQVTANAAAGALLSVTGVLNNLGHITATGGTGGGIGVYANLATGTSISNSGSITATATGGGQSIGIEFTGAIHNDFDGVVINNSGDINAQIAIEGISTASPTSSPVLLLNNSGTIEGEIIAGPGPDSAHTSGRLGAKIQNTGSITGTVHLSTNGDDLYDGRGGTLTGGIYLGGGTDLAYLGDDGEHAFGGAGMGVVVGGAGADTITGGTGPDILIGGGGADTLTGSPGDVFAMTPDAGAVTVTNFAGDRLDVSGWGLHNLADVQAHAVQSGANTVITVGSSSVTLQNVTLTNLSAVNLIFAANYSPFAVSGAYTFPSNYNQSVVGSNGGYGAYDLSASATLTLAGVTLVEDNALNDTLVAVRADGANASLNVAAGASFTALALGSGSSVDGFYAPSAPANFSNDSYIDLSGRANATGVVLVVGGTFANAANGLISITGESGTATGVVASGFTNATNTGVITVFAPGQVEGFDLTAGATVNNSGAIVASSSGGVAYGVLIGDNVGGVSTVVNSGLIEADYAVNAIAGTGSLVVTNSGELEGNVVFGTAAGNQLHNTGLVTGHVTFTGTSGAQLYDGRGGYVEGGVAFQSGAGVTGTDTAYLGDSGEAVQGGTATLVAVGGAGADTIAGGTGNDFIDGGAGNDTLDGGGGVNTAVFASSPNGVTVSLALQGSGQITGDGTKALSNFQNLLGSAFADHLTGDANNNVIDGGGGNDVLDGGGGTNTLSFASATTGVTVSLALQGQAQATGVGSVTATNFQNLLGSAFADHLTGDAGNNVIDGGGGNDVLDGGGGVNTVSFASATTGVTVNLELQGQAQNTGAGTDTLTNFQALVGSSFGDLLTASSGTSTLTGGAGADMFRAPLDIGTATVTDFSDAQGDKIDLTAFSGLRSFADVQAIAHQVNADTVLTLGSGSMTLTGVTLSSLTATDFLFPSANHQSLDITGDHKADLIFRDPATGDWGYAAMNGGSSFTWHDIGASTPSYSIDGTGDFNGDGIGDLIFRNHATGDWGIADMNTSGGYVWHDMAISTPSYSIDGTGDFNGDGTSDIIFRNHVTGDWGVALMHPNGTYTWDPLPISTPSYAIAGTGDFNGDGTSDILFRNSATGEWGYAAMNKQGGYTWDDIGPTTASYSIDGTGDFNGDGTSDVIFRNNTTGDWGYAAMNKQGGYTWVYMGPSTPSYAIVGTGDFNGDGVSDILFRNPATGDWGYAAMHPNATFTWVDMGVSTPAYFIA